MCVGIVGCSDVFELSHSINSKWQFLHGATSTCSERYVRLSFAETLNFSAVAFVIYFHFRF